MAFKSRLKCLFLKPIFCILFATFLHFARNTTVDKIFKISQSTNISMDFIIRDHYPLTLQTHGMSEALYLAVMTSCVLYRLRNAGSVK